MQCQIFKKAHSKLDTQTRWLTMDVMISWRLSIVIAVVFHSKSAISSYVYGDCDLKCSFIVVGVFICLVPSCICYWWCARQMRNRDGRYQRFNIANQNAVVVNKTSRTSQMIATSSEEFTTYPEGYNLVPQQNPDPCNDTTNSDGVHVYVNPVSTEVPPYPGVSQA